MPIYRDFKNTNRIGTYYDLAPSDPKYVSSDPEFVPSDPEYIPFDPKYVPSHKKFVPFDKTIIYPDFKIATNYNTDGIGNCLQQPGQLSNQLHKSMRSNLTHLSNFRYRD